MKLEVGKYYKTRSGRKAYVGWQACDNPFVSPNDTAMKFGGYVEGIAGSRRWMGNGSGSAYAMGAPTDLVEEWREPAKSWLTIVLIRSEGGYVYPTLECLCQDKKVVARKVVTITEGEGM
jgi:hypothetical protein